MNATDSQTATWLNRLSIGLQVSAAIAGLYAILWPLAGGISAFIFAVAGLMTGMLVSKLKDDEVTVKLDQATESTTELHEKLATLDPRLRRRKLTADQQEHLLTNLRRFSGGPVDVRPAKQWWDQETADFLLSLYHALETAKWPVNEYALGPGEEPNQQVGLSIRAYSQNGQPPQHAHSLRQCIEFLGIPVSLEISRARDDPRIELIVGKRQLY